MEIFHTAGHFFLWLSPLSQLEIEKPPGVKCVRSVIFLLVILTI